MSDENQQQPEDQTLEEQAQEAIEREAAESDSGNPPEGATMAIKDVRYLGTGVKITDPDADGFQAITYLIDSRTQHTYIFGPQTAAYFHEKTLSAEARELLRDDAVVLPQEPSDG